MPVATEECELPRYRLRKNLPQGLAKNSYPKVWALRVKKVTKNPNGSVDVFWKEERYMPINYNRDWNLHHKPRAGEYFVTYPEGNIKSFVSAQDFKRLYCLDRMSGA